MGTTAAMIGEWFDRGVQQKMSHLIVVCDTWDYEDYPVYVPDAASFWKTYDTYKESSMQRIMEVYDLGKDRSEQLHPGVRTNNLPPR